MDRPSKKRTEERYAIRHGLSGWYVLDKKHSVFVRGPFNDEVVAQSHLEELARHAAFEKEMLGRK